MFKQERYDLKGAAFEVYKDRQLETRYKPDLFVFDGIVVEVKAVTELTSEHEAQLFNYMRIARHRVGYLINFGHKGELQWKRFVWSDLHDRKANHDLDDISA